MPKPHHSYQNRYKFIKFKQFINNIPNLNKNHDFNRKHVQNHQTDIHLQNCRGNYRGNYQGQAKTIRELSGNYRGTIRELSGNYQGAIRDCQGAKIQIFN